MTALMTYFAMLQPLLALAMGDVASACVKARRSRTRSGLAFTQATPLHAVGLGCGGQRTAQLMPTRCECGNEGRIPRGRLPAAMSEDSRARGARLDLYQGHLTDMEIET